jgi:DNA-binding CsgD family transcriptional regulator
VSSNQAVLQKVCEQSRCSGGAIVGDRTVVDFASDFGRDRIGNIGEPWRRIVHAPARPVAVEPVPHVKVLLEVMTQREIHERPLASRQLHRRRQPALHELLTADANLAAHFEQAPSLHEQTPGGFEAARTRLAYGARLRRARNRVLARDQLRSAVDIFEQLGASPWAERARAELAATGEKHRRPHAHAIDQLTPQELQIAISLAAGKTTKETAAALFLSPKTVEHHLRHIYQKLGIHSRDELAKTLAAHRALLPRQVDVG